MISKTVESKDSVEYILCACGCGQSRLKYNIYRGKPRKDRMPKFIRGHGNKEKRNGQWKGDNVGYHALHEWVRKRFPKPKLCQICYSEPPRDLANISGKYLRDLTDWQYLCRRCHMKSEDRIYNLTSYIYKKKHNIHNDLSQV